MASFVEPLPGRNPVNVLFLILAVVGVAGGGGTAVYFAIKAADAEQRAQEAEDEARSARRNRDRPKQPNRWQMEALEARQEAEEAQRMAEKEAHRAKEAEAVARMEADHARAQAVREQERAELALYASRLRLAAAAFGGKEIERARQQLELIEPNQRHWEWHFLRNAGEMKPAGKALPKGSEETRFAMRPDGLGLAVGTVEHKICVYDNEMRLQQTLPGHGAGGNQAMVFAPDGKTLASVGQDGGVILWDLAGGKSLWEGKGQIAMGNCLQFTPDGKRLAVGGSDGKIVLYDTADGRQIHGLGGHTVAVQRMAISANGKYLVSAAVTAGKKAELKLFEVGTLGYLRNLPKDGPPVTSLTFDSTGKQLAEVSEDGIVAMWDVEDGHVTRSIRSEAGVSSAAWHPDGKRLACAGRDGKILLFDSVGQLVLDLKPQSAQILGVAFSADGRRLIALSREPLGGVAHYHVWDAPDR